VHPRKVQETKQIFLKGMPRFYSEE
jgi:hypothetical protein